MFETAQGTGAAALSHSLLWGCLRKAQLPSNIIQAQAGQRLPGPHPPAARALAAGPLASRSSARSAVPLAALGLRSAPWHVTAQT